MDGGALLITTLRRHRQVNLCEVCRMSFKTARATQRNPVPKTKRNKTIDTSNIRQNIIFKIKPGNLSSVFRLHNGSRKSHSPELSSDYQSHHVPLTHTDIHVHIHSCTHTNSNIIINSQFNRIFHTLKKIGYWPIPSCVTTIFQI